MYLSEYFQTVFVSVGNRIIIIMKSDKLGPPPSGGGKVTPLSQREVDRQIIG